MVGLALMLNWGCCRLGCVFVSYSLFLFYCFWADLAVSTICTPGPLTVDTLMALGRMVRFHSQLF